jgi:peroxiredoxin
MLPYPLCSDWHKITCKDYDVYNVQDQVANRSIFLIDKTGVIKYMNTSFNASKQADYDAVFEELKKL